MNLQGWLTALFVILALAGCAQVAAEQGQQPYTPYPPANNGEYPATGAVMAAEEMVVSGCSTLNRTSPDRCTEARGVPRNSAAAR